MAGVCFYNFTVAFHSSYPDIMSDGPNKLQGTFGKYFDKFLGYKNAR